MEPQSEAAVAGRTESFRAAVAVPEDDGAGVAVPQNSSREGRKDLATSAFKNGDVEASRAVHDALKISSTEKHAGSDGDYVKPIVFGGLDGIITTFAVVASVNGANLGVEVVLIMGFANLLADGVSMGFGEFLSGDAENKHIMQERAREQWELESFAEGEIEEMVELYEEKGFAREDAEVIIRTMAKNEKFFVDHMMVQELGMLVPSPDEPSPLAMGIVMFTAFMIFGIVPLLAYICFSSVADKDTLFGLACAFTAVALFGLGAFSSKFNSGTWYTTGAWVLANGTTAAGVAYFIGWLMAEIVEVEHC